MNKENGDKIFIINGESITDTLIEFPWKEIHEGKNLEDALQSLIENNPDIIPGSQIYPDREEQLRFLLLSREMSVRNWSLDILMIDQDGILTLIECKLVENPEARRDVIGQIMEYAAHAKLDWGDGRAKNKAIEYWNNKGKNLDDVIRENFDGIEVEDFWNLVEKNLNDGYIRLIIAADKIKDEVRKTIEYLNLEMKKTEIYGLELKRYKGESKQIVIVPHLIGKPIEPPEPLTRWTKEKMENYLNELTSENSKLAKRLKEILELVISKKCFIELTTKEPSLQIRKRNKRIFSFYNDGSIYWCTAMQYYKNKEERDKLQKELKTLKMIPPDFNSEEVVYGKTLGRSILDMGEDEFNNLLNIISNFLDYNSKYKEDK